MISKNSDFVDDGNRELLLELIEVLESGYIRNVENSTNNECAEYTQPDEMDVRMYLENKLSEDSGLSRVQLEELATRCMFVLSSQNIIAAALARKVNERMHDLNVLKQNYKDLEIQIDSIEQKLLCTLATIQSPDNIQFDRNRSTVATQVNQDDESASPEEATSTADSEQVLIFEDESVANEDTALAAEETLAIAKESSSPDESQKSDVQQIVNTALVPELPVTLVPEVSLKPIAPAPQIRIHLLDDQVALTWSMLEKDLSAYEPMHSYQVYGCMETSAPPTSANWWKLIELPADPLPMTCVVDRCTVGKYYFAVRGIDVQKRIGPFSSPVPVIFDI